MNFSKLPTVYKAVAAFVALLVPLLDTIQVALSDGVVTQQEWIAIIVAAAALIGGTGAVYQVRNKTEKEL